MNIVLDLDGTILDTRDRHYLLYKKLCMENNLYWADKNEYWKLRKDKYSNSDVIKKYNNLSAVKNDHINNCWRTLIESQEYLAHDYLFPGVQHWLGNMSKKFNIYLVSIRTKKINAYNQIKNLGLVQYFKAINFIEHSASPPEKEKAQCVNKLHLEKPVVWIGDTEVVVRSDPSPVRFSCLEEAIDS